MILKKHKTRYLILMLLTFVLIGAQWTVPALAQSGYDLDWWTVDGGGVSAPSGTGYTLGGTVGQPDAATWQGTDGYILSGGFWMRREAAATYAIYLPIIVRQFSATGR